MTANWFISVFYSP